MIEIFKFFHKNFLSSVKDEKDNGENERLSHWRRDAICCRLYYCITTVNSLIKLIKLRKERAK